MEWKNSLSEVGRCPSVSTREVFFILIIKGKREPDGEMVWMENMLRRINKITLKEFNTIEIKICHNGHLTVATKGFSVSPSLLWRTTATTQPRCTHNPLLWTDCWYNSTKCKCPHAGISHASLVWCCWSKSSNAAESCDVQRSSVRLDEVAAGSEGGWRSKASTGVRGSLWYLPEATKCQPFWTPSTQTPHLNHLN